MELKTLKDFKVNPKSWAGAMANAGRKYTIEISDLKQEAIKWYKKLEELKKSNYYNKKDDFQRNFQENPEVALRFLEIFFNITEKDLI